MKQVNFVLALAAATVSAQQIINYGDLPSCAADCTNLKDAQAVCPTGDKTCFCETNYFRTTLYFTPYGPLCTQSPSDCSTSDDNKIKQWVYETCADYIPPGGTVPPGYGSSSGSTVTGSSGAVQTGVPAGSEADESDDDGKSWWDLHGKWIGMVIALVIGFGIIICLGLWLKKRHNRKRNMTEPPPAEWGPRQSQHYSGNLNVHSETYEKSGNMESVPGRTQSRNNRSSGGRLTKLIGR